MAARTPREALFSELQPLIAPTRGKPDPHENLTDVLEIMAVGEGLKPAHVQGQGMRDNARLDRVEAIATRHGLRALRTQSVLAFFHRTPNIPQMVLDGQRADERARLNAEPPVLWVYAGDAVGRAIPDTVAGTRSVREVLGYPECCVQWESERIVVINQAYIEGISQAHHTSDADEILRLHRANVKVPVAVPEEVGRETIPETLKRFPYVQFSACPTCLDAKESAAGTLNRQLRDLAFALSPPFGRSIWEAARTVAHRGRAPDVGPYNACPCGSGAKFRWCCSRVRG